MFLLKVFCMAPGTNDEQHSSDALESIMAASRRSIVGEEKWQGGVLGVRSRVLEEGMQSYLAKGGRIAWSEAIEFILLNASSWNFLWLLFVYIFSLKPLLLNWEYVGVKTGMVGCEPFELSRPL
ncbi:hypothetical protein Cni_G10322 [Canna indica]|uniref:Uncharacterized protein n=1 Tax=Canna indica TaxID=4628 RepID=A0AAQ3QAJ3_9LILI|nr:hypothetical protein Cni_G10322 [Canna indica]